MWNKNKGTDQLGSYQPMCSHTQKTDFLMSRLISVKTRKLGFTYRFCLFVYLFIFLSSCLFVM